MPRIRVKANVEPIHEPLPRLPAPELMVADLPQRRAILDPILTTKSLALVHGPRGLGKTFFAMGIAWAAASGGSFLGWTSPRPHRVLYVDGEMAAIDMQERLKLLGSAPPTLDFMLADLNPGIPPDLGHYEGQLRLTRNWGTTPELIVLDNLSSLVGFRAGDPDRWNELQRFLMLQRRCGRAVLVVHHTNKKGLQRGTNRREDVLDLVLALRRPPDYQPADGARFQIHFDMARGLHGEATDTIEARLETDQMGVARWDWRPAQQADVDRVAALLKEGLSVRQIASELGISKGRSHRLREKAMMRDAAA